MKVFSGCKYFKVYSRRASCCHQMERFPVAASFHQNPSTVLWRTVANQFTTSDSVSTDPIGCNLCRQLPSFNYRNLMLNLYVKTETKTESYCAICINQLLLWPSKHSQLWTWMLMLQVVTLTVPAWNRIQPCKTSYRYLYNFIQKKNLLSNTFC